MAKNKEKQLSYLQVPLPESGKVYKMVKRSWNGLNYRQTVDTGMLSYEKNISTAEAPYLVPSQMPVVYFERYKNLANNEVQKGVKVLGIFGFDKFLLVIYRVSSTIYVDYIVSKNKFYTGIVSSNAKTDDCRPRCVVQFNVYDAIADPVDGQYFKKLLIFPDRVSMPMKIVDTGETYPPKMEGEKRADVLYRWEDKGRHLYGTFNFGNGQQESTEFFLKGEETFQTDSLSIIVRSFDPEEGSDLPPVGLDTNYYYQSTGTGNVYAYVTGTDDEGNKFEKWQLYTPPSIAPINYATVHLSRVFGVSDDKVYASGFNDYGNWTLDTIDVYNESNAWCSATQSNSKADGVFTGITTFQGHVVCFKKDFMHEIYNNKNPFRIQDIYAEGAIDNRTIQDVDGKLFFVSEDEVKVYTGGNPRIVSYNLNLNPITYAVSGTDDRNYYLYCEDKEKKGRFFVYDTYIGEWSERNIGCKVHSFAHNSNGMYALGEDGVIYRLDSGEYSQSWSFETDLVTNETVNIKHIRKLQMYADIGEGASIKVYALYDNKEFGEDSHLLYDSKGETGKRAIRVKPRQTANYGFKIHVEGSGYVRLYEMELEMENGGGLYV